ALRDGEARRQRRTVRSEADAPRAASARADFGGRERARRGESRRARGRRRRVSALQSPKNQPPTMNARPNAVIFVLSPLTLPAENDDDKSVEKVGPRPR